MLPRHNSEEQLLENGWMKSNDKIVMKLQDSFREKAHDNINYYNFVL